MTHTKNIIKNQTQILDIYLKLQTYFNSNFLINVVETLVN